MSTPNPFAYLYGSDHETFNKAVTTPEPSFLHYTLRGDYDDGQYDDVRAALSGPPLLQFNDFMDAKEKLDKSLDNQRFGQQGALNSATQHVGQGQPGSQPITNQPDNRYRLEVCDAKHHRMGDYLKGALDEFEKEPFTENPNFFRWVESEVQKDAAGAAKRWNDNLFANIKGANAAQQEAKYIEWFKKRSQIY